MKNNLKKGATLLEVVIAMALIILITGTSIGVMGVFNQSSIRSSDKAEAIAMIGNVKELFLFADDRETFEEYLPVVADIDITVTEGSSVYTFSEPNYNGYFQVSYKNGVATFSALLKDANNKTVLEIDQFDRKL